MQRLIVIDSEVRVIPSSVTLSGTYSSNGKLVTGTGIDFIEEMLIGGAGGDLKYKYLVSEDRGQIIEIESVLSTTTLLLKQAFDSDVASQNIVVNNPADGMTSCGIYPLDRDVTVGNVNESPVLVKENIGISYSNSNGLTPIVINGLANLVQVTIQ
jgi:hypothetical protein